MRLVREWWRRRESNIQASEIIKILIYQAFLSIPSIYFQDRQNSIRSISAVFFIQLSKKTPAIYQRNRPQAVLIRTPNLFQKYYWVRCVFREKAYFISMVPCHPVFQSSSTGNSNAQIPDPSVIGPSVTILDCWNSIIILPTSHTVITHSRYPKTINLTEFTK